MQNNYNKKTHNASKHKNKLNIPYHNKNNNPKTNKFKEKQVMTKSKKVNKTKQGKHFYQQLRQSKRKP